MSSVDFFNGRHNVTTVVSTVNKQRGLAMQQERKSYHVSEHEPQNSLQQQYYSVVETIHRLETQAILPTKWQALAISRTPRHGQLQPSQSIFHSQWPQQSGPESGCRRRESRPDRTSSTVNNSTKADGIRKVRFANRFDRRFYVKGSQSIDQLAKLSWGNDIRGTFDETGITEALNNLQISQLSTDMAMAPTKNIYTPAPSLTNTIAIDHISQAIREERPVQEILRLLQHEHFDHTIPTISSTSSNAGWLKNMYSMVKTQLIQKKKHANERTSTVEREAIENLSHIKTLLNIYLHSESVVQQALALTQWSRFEITVESLSLDDFTNTQRPSFSQQRMILGEVFHSSEQTSHKLKSMGKLPEHCIAAVSSTMEPGILLSPTASSPIMVDYTRKMRKDKSNNGTSNRYCINDNAALANENMTDIHLKISSKYLSCDTKMENNDMTNQVGQVRIPCSFFRYLCRQPEKSYTLERDLVTVIDTTKDPADDDDKDEEGAGISKQNSPPAGSVKFSIRKVPLKKGFLLEKEKLVREKLQTVLDWIQRFRDTTGLCALPGCSGSSKKINVPSNSNSSARVSLLHAAILVQSPDMVGRLITLGSNPFANSGVVGEGRASSSMALALTMWDRCGEESRQRDTVNTIIQMLQGILPYAPDNCCLTTGRNNNRNASKAAIPANPTRSNPKRMDVAPKLPAQPRSPTANINSVEKENRAEKHSSKKGGQRKKKKKSQSSRIPKDPVPSPGDPLVVSASSRSNKNDKSSSHQTKLHKRKENVKTDRTIHRCP